MVKDYSEAHEWCEKQWGIFWTVNAFDGERKKENCKKILSWAVDIDVGSKQSQLKRIGLLPISPSLVIETARGHHVYFDSIDGTAVNYHDIVLRLIAALGGDEKAKDVCRILRAPFFFHWKDPANPFLIKIVYQNDCAYTEKEIKKLFPSATEKELEVKSVMKKELRFQKDQKLWERIYSLNCREILQRLSGSAAVNGEIFSFKPVAGNKFNLCVNGKPTSCWIDSSGRIGSTDRGGPTIWQWVNWYHRDHKKTYELLKAELPEVFNVR